MVGSNPGTWNSVVYGWISTRGAVSAGAPVGRLARRLGSLHLASIGAWIVSAGGVEHDHLQPIGHLLSEFVRPQSRVGRITALRNLRSWCPTNRKFAFQLRGRAKCSGMVAPTKSALAHPSATQFSGRFLGMEFPQEIFAVRPPLSYGTCQKRVCQTSKSMLP